MNNLVNEIIEAKVAIRNLKSNITKNETLLRERLIEEAPECLSINWDMLCRKLKVPPLKYRC